MTATPAAEQVLAAFAQAIVERQFEAAHVFLAPWVLDALPAGGVKKVVRRCRGDNPPAAAFELCALPYNNVAEMRDHVAEYADENAGRSLANCDGTGGMYGPPSYPIPEQLTEANFQGVWRIEFLPDPEMDAMVDYSYAFYVALVAREAGGQGLAIGYLEPMD